MIAPEEFNRNRKTVSGDAAAAMTQRKPIRQDTRIAENGTPRLLTLTNCAGASRRPDSTNNIRDAVYRPEFRQESTAVRTTAFMMWSAPGMPISVNAATNGDAPISAEFHGTITASRNTEPTKKIATRKITDLVALAMARSGLSDSAAAMVAISAPTIEKMTTTIDAKIAATPFGNIPPYWVRLEKSMLLCGQMPKTKRPPSTMNAMIAKTLIPANQNSNSPNDFTENRLVAVIRTIRPSESSQSGASIQ